MGTLTLLADQGRADVFRIRGPLARGEAVKRSWATHREDKKSSTGRWGCQGPKV